MKICESCGACFDDAYDLCGFDGGALESWFPGNRVVGGRYLLEQRVAGGAMGVVVRATHLQVGSTVAVKLMRPEKDDTHVALARFQREAQILGQIKHPNAVLVIDFGVEQRTSDNDASVSQPYLVMEYLRGEPLSAVLAKKGRLTLVELERILVPLCEAVEEAHAVGVIHRDLKPSNVVLEKLRDGSEIVKVLDFGIAKFVARGPAQPAAKIAPPASTTTLVGPAPITFASSDGDVIDELADLLADDEDDAFLDEVVSTRSEVRDEVRSEVRDGVGDDGHEEVQLTMNERRAKSSSSDVVGELDNAPVKDPTTEAGFMIGTVPYMAPEQMTGERVSVRTDVHAVAVLAFQCLAGRLPYDGDDEDIIASKLSDERPSLADVGVDVPDDIDRVLQRAFALDPSERPATVREIGDAFRNAVHSPRVDDTDAGGAATVAIVKIGAIEKSLASVAAAVRAWVESETSGEDHYARARDLLLAVDAPLRRVRAALEAAPAHGFDGAGASDARARLAEAKVSFEAQVKSVRRMLARVAPEAASVDAASARTPAATEFGEYLVALWTRLDVVAQEIIDGLAAFVDDDKLGDAGPARVEALFAATDTPRASTLAELTDRLLAKDPLDAVDALDELLESAVDQVVQALAPARDSARADAPSLDVVTRLLRGLWRHADTLLLHELAPSRRAFRLLPFIAGLRDFPAAAPFVGLAKALGQTRLDAAGLDALLASPTFERADDRSVLLRCLLVHPSDAVRTRAIGALELNELWNVIAHPSTPIAVLHFLFANIRERARNEYVKIFFFCVRDNLGAAASSTDVQAALALVASFFSVSCFHEDIVFEPLLELDRLLRQKPGASSAAVDARYSEALAAFTAGGSRDTKPLEQMRDVPLPIQRKLAREGRFLTYFVSHSNDRVARETLPHLYRLDDVTPFLRIATIHRIVLTELAKRKRFFRKEPPKLALLQNPKTPAIVARVFLPLVGEDQLRILSTNKHINPDVRRLITSTLARER